mmetsp:Transcript_19642/g.52134  ORF Transcript_19642/g.52134 Transcript_19642/m.52134 type:complete len:348 (+) Transcript_19642:591-1634(+)
MSRVSSLHRISLLARERCARRGGVIPPGPRRRPGLALRPSSLGVIRIQHLRGLLGRTPRVAAGPRIALAAALGADLLLELLQRVRDLLPSGIHGYHERHRVPDVTGREERVDVGGAVCPLEEAVQVELQRHGEVEVEQHGAGLAEVEVPPRGDLARHDQDGGLAQLEALEAAPPRRLRGAEVQGPKVDVLERLSDELRDAPHVARVRNDDELPLLDEVVELDQPLEALILGVTIFHDLQVVLHSLQRAQQLRVQPACLLRLAEDPVRVPVGARHELRRVAAKLGVHFGLLILLLVREEHTGLQLAFLLLPLGHAQVQDVPDEAADPQRQVRGVHGQLLQLHEHVLND